MEFFARGAEGLVMAVRAQPGAKKVVIGPVVPAADMPGWPPARLKIAVNAPPEDGRADAAIIAALASWLGVKPGAIVLSAGGTARIRSLPWPGLLRFRRFNGGGGGSVEWDSRRSHRLASGRLRIRPSGRPSAPACSGR
jgi:uncharacterized protein YggU (UPF0235/DUF167 family)